MYCYRNKKEPAGTCPAGSFLIKTNWKNPNLFYFNFSASLGQLSLDGLCIILGNALFQSLWCAINYFFCFLQAQASDLANNLDYVDLVSASGLQDNIELGLLISSSAACSSRSSSSYSNWSSSGYAELLFQSLYQLGQLKNGKSFLLLQSGLLLSQT